MIAPLQIPQLGAVSGGADFTPLANLGEVYQAARIRDARQTALSDLGRTQNGSVDYNKGIQSLAALGDLEGAGKIAAIQKSVAPESSADLQAYGLYQRQGGSLPFIDFKKQLAAAGATRVNTTVNSGEKAYDTAVGKEYGDAFTNINKAGRDSVGAISNLDLMENLTKDPNFYSGAGAATVTQAKKLAASLGIAGADAAAPNELFQKLSQKAVLDASGGSLGAGFSNADRDFLNGTVANISNTPEGNRRIIGISRRVEQRKQEVAKFARDYAAKNGGRIDAGFDDALSKWATENPAFPQDSRGKSSSRLKFNPATGVLE